MTATTTPERLQSLNVSRDCPRPDENGRYGPFGGRFVPETLMSALLDLEAAYREASADPAFREELDLLLSEYAGRPTPLFFAKRFSEAVGGGVRVYLKREDLLHTGAHKINNTLGQALLAKRLGKTRVIAETGAGQHGVATATVCALLGLECEIYMGEVDAARQAPNVFRMELLGAKVTPVSSGARTLKDATNEAMRDWMANCDGTHYIIGSVVGPHPFPMIVRNFQSVIGNETREQIQAHEGRLPDHIVACVGGGSNAMGIFHAFFDDAEVALWGVEAAGEGLNTPRHAASVAAGEMGVFHGSRSLVLQTGDGQITPAHSVSAGLDYPGVGPEHAFYAACGRASYASVSDEEALDAARLLCRTEGILPALESAHALAYVRLATASWGEEALIVVCLSGRGDKDASTYRERLGKGAAE